MKSVGQINSERYLLLATLTKWLAFSKVAAYSPPKTYFDTIGRLRKETEAALQFCREEKESLTHGNEKPEGWKKEPEVRQGRSKAWT